MTLSWLLTLMTTVPMTTITHLSSIEILGASYMLGKPRHPILVIIRYFEHRESNGNVSHVVYPDVLLAQHDLDSLVVFLQDLELEVVVL